MLGSLVVASHVVAATPSFFVFVWPTAYFLLFALHFEGTKL